MKNKGVIEFHKSKVAPNGRGIQCDGKQCDGKIHAEEKYWQSGTLKRNPFVLCQKCFGFWLSRYSMFEYNPFDIDAVDNKWKNYFDEEWARKTLEAFALALK